MRLTANHLCIRFAPDAPVTTRRLRPKHLSISTAGAGEAFAMDDLYAINEAKTEFREACNTGDVERLIAIFDPEIVDFSDGRACAFAEGAGDAWRAYFRNLFSRYRVHLDPIVIEIRILGDMAYDYGWHAWTLVPFGGGEPVTRRERYVDIWRKDESGEWKLWMFMNNEDVPMPAVQAAA